jgi:hypothetical protein
VATWLEVAAAVLALLVIWFWYESRPLSDEEISRLARYRRLGEIARLYPFGGVAYPESFDLRSLKSGMTAVGRFYRIDEALQRFPAIGGALLKGKKHEWTLFAFAKDDRVVGLWLNKGPDATQVWPTVSRDALTAAGRNLRVTAVLQFHNHPNSDPRWYTTRFASGPDQRFATIFGNDFVEQGVSFHGFVVERGVAHQYACWVPPSVAPLRQLASLVRDQNGLSRRVRFGLRQESGQPVPLGRELSQPNASHNVW